MGIPELPYFDDTTNAGNTVWRCTRCGAVIEGNGDCGRCFPLPTTTACVDPSPTIDVLDLDRSALRALEEIANG